MDEWIGGWMLSHGVLNESTDKSSPLVTLGLDAHPRFLLLLGMARHMPSQTLFRDRTRRYHRAKRYQSTRLVSVSDRQRAHTHGRY